MYSLWITGHFLAGRAVAAWTTSALLGRLRAHRTGIAALLARRLAGAHSLRSALVAADELSPAQCPAPEPLHAAHAVAVRWTVRARNRRGARARVRLAWGVLLGISAAAFWLTREEGIWVLPGATLLIGSAGWNSWRAGERFRPLLVPMLAATVCAVGMVGTVSAMNYRYYGWFGTVEFRAPEFLSAYGALQRPISSEQIPYVPVTRETRRKLYDVSPAFAELKLVPGRHHRTVWAANSDDVTGRPPEDREIAGGWFMWALRDAAAAAGHAHSAREALDFYSRIGRVIALAMRVVWVPPEAAATQ